MPLLPSRFASAALVAYVLGFGLPAMAQPVQAAGPGWIGQQGAAGLVIDVSGQQTLAQIEQRFALGESEPVDAGRFMPTGGKTAVWYRLAFPAVAVPTPLVLALPHPGMNQVELYRPSADGGWGFERSGDAIPVAQWPLPYLHPAFELVLQPGEVRASYLRVQHSHPINVRWAFWSARDFREYGQRWHFFLGVYVGLVALVILICALNAYALRDPIHLYCAAYVLFLTLGQLSLTGLAGEYLWPGNAWWNDAASNVLPVMGVALGHLFMRELLRKRGARWSTRLLLGMAAAGAGLALGFLLVGRDPLFAISSPYYLASFAVYLGAALWYAWRIPGAGLWVLAGMLALLAGSVFPILRNMQLLPVSFLTQYGAQLGAAVQIPLLLVALYLRGREKRQTLARVDAMATADPLTGVANHQVMLQRLAQLLEHQQRDPGAGVVIRVRIGNIQDIRDEYGLQVAQMALVHAGACISQVVREGDSVARHRDGDFVLILQGRMERDSISTIGQRLIARGLAPSSVLPPGAVLQLKLGIAAAPFQVQDVDDLLQALEAVVTELAARPGKALRFIT